MLILRLYPLIFILAFSCATQDFSQYGRVNLYGQGSKNFTFAVSDDYLRANQNSKPDKVNPKMTVAESDLLLNLLKQKKYCLNNSGKIFFRITSKQEKIYDMTFAHLIEQNYNARPVTPVIYYGECLNKPITMKDAIKQISDETKAEIQQ
ncbi:MAG: hypothetical protein SFV53_05005 [Rickettsiales bacterium]|nr:hypothetical protein [Rickettsiales bacterium]